MERAFEQLNDREILAVIGDGLDALFDDRLRLPSDAEQLAMLQVAVRLGGRLLVWQERLAARIEKSEAVWNERKTSSSTWLAESMNLTVREAKRLIRAGQGLRRFPVVGAAAEAGAVLPVQAEAITAVLADLPKDFDEQTVRRGQELMVEFAQSHNSAELRRLTAYLIETLSPGTADQIEARRLERQERRAQAHRFLEFKNDGDGSVLIRGSLPTAAAEPLIRIVDAYAAAEHHGLERLDPNTDYVTPAMRRADDDRHGRASDREGRSLDEGRASGPRNRWPARHGPRPHPTVARTLQRWRPSPHRRHDVLRQAGQAVHRCRTRRPPDPHRRATARLSGTPTAVRRRPAPRSPRRTLRTA